MKNPKTTTKKSGTKTKKTEQSVKPASKAKKAETSVEEPVTNASPKKTAESVKKGATKKASPKKKLPKKDQAAAAKDVVDSSEITIPDRIGSTAGSIWHLLTENGTCSVASLVKEIDEDEKIIQRSIGWLAQEGKIVLDTTSRVEMIALK